MKRIGILIVALGLCCTAYTQNITVIEYFFDADPGYGSGTSVTITPAASITNLNFNVSISSVSDGFHTLTVRAKDANNKWSHAFTRPFYKLPASAIAAAPNITKLEYFFDADPGYGAGTNVTITAATAINNLNVTASLAAVSDGFHTITFRAQDANGKWSPAFTRPFYKLPAAVVAAAPNITKLEYFFDADPGYGAGTNVTITPGTAIIDLTVTASLSSVSDGFHTITFRTQDANNNWSPAFTRPFYKLPATSIAAAPNITKLEYFFDGDPGYGAGTNVTITPGVSISALNVTADLSSVVDGFHTITFRTKDANNNWGPAFTRPFYKLPAAAIAAAPNITKLEYFIDTDPGYGQGTDVTITPATTISSLLIDISVTALSTGAHTINLRAKDASDNWSMVYSANFGVFGPAPVAQPTNITFSSITTSSYTVTYTAPVTAPAGYIAIRKAGSAPTTDPVDGTTYTKGNSLGNGTVAYVGTATTFPETGLLSGTQYFYKIYAYNGSGSLTNYLTTTPLANNTTTAFDPIQITGFSFPDTYDKGGSLTVSITVNNATRVSAVVLKYKGISEPNTAIKSETLSAIGNQFQWIFTNSELTDAIGMRYDFEVTDLNQTLLPITTRNTHIRYPQSSSEQNIPLSSFGGELKNYTIISIPLLLNSSSPSLVFRDLFDALPGDGTKYRLFDFYQGENREYSGDTVYPGKGYWLIVRNSITINPGEGTTVGDQDDPYQFELKPGWNLIGNPYNFRISWADVLAASGIPALDVSTKISLFDNGALKDGDVIDRYRGGFVKNKTSSDLVIKFPVLKNTSLSGNRISETIDLENNAWELPLTISNSDLTNMRSGIGMHPKASITETDLYDAEQIPLFDGFAMPELLFPTAYKTVLNKQIVPTQKNFTWQLSANPFSGEGALISWPKVDEVSDKKLVLLDLATMRVLDMTRQQEIKLGQDSKILKIFYGDAKYIQAALEKELPAIGQPYPNPAHEEVKIPFFVTESAKQAHVKIQVFNTLGAEITTLTDKTFAAGSHELLWKPEVSAGLYIISMTVGNTEKKVKVAVQ